MVERWRGEQPRAVDLRLRKTFDEESNTHQRRGQVVATAQAPGTTFTADEGGGSYAFLLASAAGREKAQDARETL